MRTSGVTDAVVGMHPNDRLCWPFDDFAEFRARAAEFLVDGLELGQRACYVARGDQVELAGHLESQPVLAAAVREGSAGVISLRSRYRTGTTVTPRAQVEAYAADATALVRSPDSLDAFCSYEHLVDKFMTTAPFTAMCAYHRAELPESTITRLNSLHPVNNARCAPFRLHATKDGIALDGESDRVSRELLSQALENTEPPHGALHVDATGLLTLHGFARSNAATLVLRSEKSALARLVALLGLQDVECVR